MQLYSYFKTDYILCQSVLKNNDSFQLLVIATKLVACRVQASAMLTCFQNRPTAMAQSERYGAVQVCFAADSTPRLISLYFAVRSTATAA